MALIKCTECGKEFSDKANACPNCGCPTEEISNAFSGSTTNLATDSSFEDESAGAGIVYRATVKNGPVQIDEKNKAFRINGKVVKNGKKDGLAKSAFKGMMAVSTLGLSVAIGSGKNKVGSKEWFDYSDLISYELLEDDSLVTSGGVGQALVGGALFGGAGAIAGGITGKRVQKKKVESMHIKVTINNFDSPCILIPLIEKPTKTKSDEYQNAFKQAHQILSMLDVIAHNKE